MWRKLLLSTVAANIFTLAKAQLESIPSCALQCSVGSLDSTGCPPTDIGCICSNTSFISSLTPCILAACSADDVTRTFESVVAICKAGGVDIEIPDTGARSSEAFTPDATTFLGPTPSTPQQGLSSTFFISTNRPNIPTETPSPSTTSSSESRPNTPSPSPSRTQSSQSSTSTDTSPTQSTPANETPNNTSSKSTNVGAIAGGVVGGIVAIALVLFGIWLIIREKNRHRERSEPMPMPPAAEAPDPYSQGIWTEGDKPFAWNPQTSARDVRGGIESPEFGVGGVQR